MAVELEILVPLKAAVPGVRSCILQQILPPPRLRRLSPAALVTPWTAWDREEGCSSRGHSPAVAAAAAQSSGDKDPDTSLRQRTAKQEAMSRNDEFAQFFDAQDTPRRASMSTPGVSGASRPDLKKQMMSPRMELLMKKERKSREDAANMTFQPHVNAVHRKTAQRTVDGLTKENRFDALYSDALKRHLESRWKDAVEQVASKELTFQPKITERGRSRPTSRVQSRNPSRASSRERERPRTSMSGQGPQTDSQDESPRAKAQARMEARVKAEHTFSPQITRRAQSIDRKESAKRLYAPNSAQREAVREEQRQYEQSTRELEKCTFAPTVNRSKEANAPTDDMAGRMAKYEEVKRKRLQERQSLKDQQEVEGVTFKPSLRDSSSYKATPPSKPFLERMARKERAIPDNVAASLNSSITFKPTLIAKRAASPSTRIPVHERLFKEGEARRRETQAALLVLQEEAQASFTFAPEINHSRDVSGDQSLQAGPVFERLATTTSKQYMQEVLLRVKAELELKDCTFQPRLFTEGHKQIERDTNMPVSYVLKPLSLWHNGVFKPSLCGTLVYLKP
ncbi:hypothetical protein B484DRAFT_469197 [Ochromonadaceae sp. CCMP2298]|nr:hypothetical protein B484DRAFT_469197 [Ochromonadaceae sp. CCMP2298]